MLYITQVIQLIAASCGLLINDLLLLYYMPPEEIPQYKASVKFHFRCIVSAFVSQLAYAIIQGTRWEGLSTEGPKTLAKSRAQFRDTYTECMLTTRKARNEKTKLCNRLSSRQGKSHKSKETNKNFIHRYRKIAQTYLKRQFRNNKACQCVQ